MKTLFKTYLNTWLFILIFSFTSGTIPIEDHYPIQLLAYVWFPVLFAGILIIQKVVAPESLDRRSVFRSRRTYGKCILLGILNTINNILVIYTSSGVGDPRTGPGLQALLRLSILPFTVFCRWLILRKGKSKSKFNFLGHSPARYHVLRACKNHNIHKILCNGILVFDVLN